MPTQTSSFGPRLADFSAVAGIVAAVIRFSVLIGWTADIDFLKRVFPGLVAMNPVTALAFILAGAGLWCSKQERPGSLNLLAKILGAVVAVIGLLRLAGRLRSYRLLFSERIISRHGGRTWAESAVDRGATFYFSLAKSREKL